MCRISSIVVLPFANLSGDASQDYLGDILYSEELTSSLSRLPDSFVVSRTTAFTYRGKAEDVKAIGKELSVRCSREARRNSGARIRVNAQLIDVETGAHLWADQFDADQGEMLEMQDAIVSEAFARALEIQLAWQSKQSYSVSRAHPENPDAEELAVQCEATLFAVGNTAKHRLQAGYVAFASGAPELDSRNVRALAVLGGAVAVTDHERPGSAS